MPNRTISTVDEAEALLDGLTLLGTGGGGSPKEWRGLLREKIEQRRVLHLDRHRRSGRRDSYGCTVFKTGSIAPANPQPELIEEMGFTEPRVPNPMVEAVHGLGERLGVEIEVVFAVELGGINTPAPMSAAHGHGRDARRRELLGPQHPRARPDPGDRIRARADAGGDRRHLGQPRSSSRPLPPSAPPSTWSSR